MIQATSPQREGAEIAATRAQIDEPASVSQKICERGPSVPSLARACVDLVFISFFEARAGKVDFSALLSQSSRDTQTHDKPKKKNGVSYAVQRLSTIGRESERGLRARLYFPFSSALPFDDSSHFTTARGC